jgi:protein-tyrosine phosphatase
LSPSRKLANHTKSVDSLPRLPPVATSPILNNAGRSPRGGPSGDTSSVFAIFFVCTGNRCRSPLAAGVMARLTEPPGIAVGSAGVLEIPGEGSPPETVRAAKRLGIDLADHLSVPISGVNLADVDLVLGFERSHVAAAVVDGGAAPERTFNLIELASLLRDGVGGAHEATDPLDRARHRIATAHRMRLETARFMPGEEVLDPIGLPLQVHVDMAAQVQELCALVAEELFGRSAIRLT